MSRRDRNTSGRPVARAAAKYTVYNVTEPAELMEFLMSIIISRHYIIIL